MFKLITGVSGGQVVDSELFNQGLRMFEGKRVEIGVKRFAHQRTSPQNRYWHGVVLALITNYAQELGEDLTKDQWHEYYVQKGYFGFEDKVVNGEEVQLPNRSKDAVTINFWEAITRVQKEWALRGLDIPSPREEEYRKGKNG